MLVWGSWVLPFPGDRMQRGLLALRFPDAGVRPSGSCLRLLVGS